MHEDSGRDCYKLAALLRTAAMLLMLVSAAGCAAAPHVASPTLTAHSTPIPTSTMTPTPSTISTPTRLPVPSTTPVSTVPPSTACMPPLSVQPVSPALIRYGNPSKMQVSLTFDSDGASAGSGSTALQYLSILRDQNVHAAFFLTGLFARAYPDVVRRILAEGHDLGNHTLDHADLARPPRIDTFVCSELIQAEQTIIAAGGHTSRPLFRPPFGSYSDQVRVLAARLGYRTVYWSIDPRDWESTATTQDIISRVLNSPALKPGAIILMHVNSPNERYALASIIAGLEQRGYAIVPLSQLLR